MFHEKHIGIVAQQETEPSSEYNSKSLIHGGITGCGGSVEQDLVDVLGKSLLEEGHKVILLGKDVRDHR